VTRTVLSVRGLCAGHAGRDVLHDVAMEIASGEWLALVGPNGSGKSTLLDCVAGCLTPSAGQVHIAGFSVHTDPLSAKQHLGYAVVPGRLPELLTGRQCLQVFADAKHVDAIGPELAGLADELRLTALLDDPIGVYSYGTRQKLSILLALVGEPVLIVLDEAFNGLDSASALILKRHLRKRADNNRCAIVLATHALDVVERCADRMILLDEGRGIGSWDRAALDALRSSGTQNCLEMTLADTICSVRARDAQGE